MPHVMREKEKDLKKIRIMPTCMFVCLLAFAKEVEDEVAAD